MSELASNGEAASARFNTSMSDAELRFVEAFVRALVGDLVEHPVRGSLSRVVIRWHEAAEPGYFTVHALGTEDDVEGIDPWNALAWGDDGGRERKRTERVGADSAVTAAAEELADPYYDLPDVVDGEYQASPALIEIARRIPSACRASGIATAPHTLALPGHFESGGGALRAMHAIEPPERVLDLLTERGELPSW